MWRAERMLIFSPFKDMSSATVLAVCSLSVCSAALAFVAIHALTKETPADGGGGGGGTPDAGRCVRGKGGPQAGTSGSRLGTHALTWYSFQDNTPCNTTATSSGCGLTPYVSAALPFRFLKQFGGSFEYGDQVHVKFLEGRTMPNGKKHTGWVRIDDFCGDGGNDTYCFQTIDGTRYPNVDIYIGDYATSGMKCNGGPAGSGLEKTEVAYGPAPPGKFVSDYGGNATYAHAKKCDCADARKRQESCNWHYTPQWEDWWKDVC